MNRSPASWFRSLFMMMVCMILPSCVVIYNLPGTKDYRIFPYHGISIDPGNVFRFHYTVSGNNAVNFLKVNKDFLCPSCIDLDAYIDDSKTLAFIIIRNDTILYERYRNGCSDSSIYNLFSITKAFITTLVGVALRDGLIRDLDQTVVEFLPEFAGKEGFDRIKLRHLMTHTSGISFSAARFNPFSDNSKYYYGRDLRELVQRAEIYGPPGQEVRYSSTNCQLLTLILERVSGSSVSSYLEKNIWSEIGMEHPATWSTDHKGEDAVEKGFSCLNCTAIDLAKLGRLYMHEGKWGDEQILPGGFVREAVSRDTTQGSSWDYQYNFRIGPEKYHSFYTRGLYGQLLYVYPEKQIIIVRMGESHLSYRPDFIMSNIMQLIDQL